MRARCLMNSLFVYFHVAHSSKWPIALVALIWPFAHVCDHMTSNQRKCAECSITNVANEWTDIAMSRSLMTLQAICAGEWLDALATCKWLYTEMLAKMSFELIGTGEMLIAFFTSVWTNTLMNVPFMCFQNIWTTEILIAFIAYVRLFAFSRFSFDCMNRKFSIRMARVSNGSGITYGKFVILLKLKLKSKFKWKWVNEISLGKLGKKSHFPILTTSHSMSLARISLTVSESSSMDSYPASLSSKKLAVDEKSSSECAFGSDFNATNESVSSAISMFVIFSEYS